MKKFILDSMPDSRGIVALRGKDFHYLARVRRVKPGDTISAVLPDKSGVTLTVLSAGNGVLTLRSGPSGEAGPAVPFMPRIILFQALPKGAKMDLIVRQAAETGVDEIVPFVSEFSQVKLPAARGAVPGAAGSGAAPASVSDGSRAGNGRGSEKLRRWERIIREARQQSGSPAATSVREPLGVGGLLEYWLTLKAEEPRAAGILLHQDPLETGTFHDYLDSGPSLVVLAIGPEGGFSPAEAARFLAAGFRPLALGNSILRTETAALYGTAAVRIILTESASWQLKTIRPPSAENA